MCEIRAIVDGKLRYGQHLKIEDVHLITTPRTEHGGVHHPGFPSDICLIGFIEIDISTAAVDTGIDILTGRIFGNKDKMQGGDYLWLKRPKGKIRVQATWCDTGCWNVEYPGVIYEPISGIDLRKLEIIKEPTEEKE